MARDSQLVCRKKGSKEERKQREESRRSDVSVGPAGASLPRALAAIPFWSRPAAESGGNSHCACVVLLRTLHNAFHVILLFFLKIKICSMLKLVCSFSLLLSFEFLKHPFLPSFTMNTTFRYPVI